MRSGSDPSLFACVNDPEPPLPYPDGIFGLIYAYSIFPASPRAAPDKFDCLGRAVFTLTPASTHWPVATLITLMSTMGSWVKA
jgi:hypothetical protein